MELNSFDMANEAIHNPDPNLTAISMSGGRVALMPNNNGHLSASDIINMVHRGRDIYSQVMDNTFPLPPGKEDIALVSWYLQSLGASKASVSAVAGAAHAGNFREGAFTIEDPSGRLKNFLDSANSYERPSSHLTGFQNLPGGHPRGVDIRGVEMPHDRRTILYQAIPPEETGGRNMLFLKMEPHGCRGLSFNGTGHRPEVEAQMTFFSKLGRSISRFFSNIHDFVGHAFGFIGSLARRAGGAADVNNRERVSSALARGFKAKVQDLSALAGDSPDLKALAARLDAVDVGSTTGGVHRVLAATSSALQELERFAGVPGGAEMSAALTRYRAEVLEQSGDHPELRFGNEVILTAGEMDIGQAHPITRPENGPISSSQRLVEAERESMQALLQHYLTLESSEQDFYISAHADDFLRSSEFLVTDATTQNQAARTIYNAVDHPDPQERLSSVRETLLQLGGPEFMRGMQTILHQRTMSASTAFCNRDYAAQTGTPIAQTGFRSGFNFSLEKQGPDPDNAAVDRYHLIMNSGGEAVDPNNPDRRGQVESRLHVDIRFNRVDKSFEVAVPPENFYSYTFQTNETAPDGSGGPRQGGAYDRE
jgi:hypothetical protein